MTKRIAYVAGKPLHDYRWVNSEINRRPVTRIVCKCGKESRWFDKSSEWREAIEWANAHQGRGLKAA